MRENDQCPLLDVSLSASKTKAPAKYDEVSLLSELENIGKYETDPKLRKLLVKSKGIGTPATRPETILQLIKHGYLAVSAKGVYTSTAKGRDLIKIAPSWLTNASLTAIWEDYLIKMCETRSESELIAMKRQFVDKQTTRISELIAKVIEDHDANKGERTVVKKPAKKPTPSMVNAIKAIAKSKGLTPDKAVFDDIKLASGFLNEHGAKKPEGYVFAPSESQMTLFNKINNELPDNKKVNVASLTDNKMFSDFISKNMKEIPPSAPQKALAEKLIAAMSAEDQKKVKKNVLTSSSACSKFITDTIASNKKGNSKKK
jgi:hypothetical protein